MATIYTDSVILNVDDTDGARYAKSRTLKRAGFTVIEAATGTEALEIAATRPLDLVLLDVKLPDINGFEVCRRLKEGATTKSILVLQISASYIGTADKIQALDQGADNYLFEPIEPEELIANVKALLRLGRVERSLREADTRKDVFLATLAHELRNPLAPILSSVAILQRQAAHSLDVQEKAVQIILRQTNHIVRLVDDLLDVSRITGGLITLRLEPVDLRTVVETAVETTATIVASRQHRLTLTLPAEPVMIDGDPVRLVQIVTNLLHNAAKFTPPGGTIDVGMTKTDERATISVADNGIGIADISLGSVFDLFSQVGHTRDRVQDGLGIGLSLVRSMAELHGGTVRATSAGLGLGSTFVIELPLQHRKPATPANGHDVGTPVKAPSRRVLVVDDNEDSARALASLLTLDGHDVRISFTGEDAIAQARELAPETVFMDIGLPGMTGCEAALRIREMPGSCDAKLIALTGYGRPEDSRRIAAAGFHHHVIKPMALAVLDDLMRSACPANRLQWPPA